MPNAPSGGTPFASLPDAEKRRRILVGVQSGQMPPEHAAVAMRYWNLSSTDPTTLTFNLKRYRDLHAAETAANQGGPPAATVARAQGYTPGGAKAVKPHGPLGLAAKVVGGVANAAVNLAEAPVRAYQAGHRPLPTVAVAGKRMPDIRQAPVSAGMVSGPSLAAQVGTAIAQRATYAPAGAVEAVKHPVRTVEQAARDAVHDPLTTAFLAAALASGAGSAASRLVGATNAVRSGEGIAAALARPGYKGGSLLHTPEPGTSTIFKPSGEKLNPTQAALQAEHFPTSKPLREMPQAASATVERLNSRNVLARKLVQEPRNKAIQARLIKGSRPVPVGGKAGRFFRQNLGPEATFGRELRAQRRVETAVAQAPVGMQQRAVHGALSQHSTSAGEAEAARIVGIFGDRAFTDPQGVVNQVIATHKRLIAEGQDVGANQEVIKDAQRALKVLKNPSERFKKAAAETKSLSDTTGNILERRGHLTAAERQQRKGAIASIYHQDPAVHGLLSERARLEKALGDTRPPKDPGAEVAKTQAKLDANLAKQQAAEASHVSVNAERSAQHPRAVEGANARASALQTEIDQNVALQAKVAGHKTLRPETKAVRLGPLKATESRLRSELQHVRARQAALEAGPKLTQANLAGLRAEESALRTRLDTLGQHQRLAEINSALEGLAPKGSFFFSQHARYTKNPPMSSGGGAYNPQPQLPGGLGPTQTSRMAPGLGHQFTGGSVEAGLRPANVFDTTADYATRVNRLTSAEDFYGNLWKIGSPVKETATQIPIRADRQIKDELRLFFKKLDDRAHGRPGMNEALDAKEYEQLVKNFQPDVKAGIGERIDGVRWVEPAYIKSLGETSIASPLEKVFDAFTQPIRSLSLYGRPAYLLNLPGNMTMQAITQGLKSFPAGARAARAVALDGEANVATVDSLMGASHARSYLVGGKGMLAQKNRQLAEAWNAVTDMWSRRSAFYHEAAAKGYSTPDEISALLHNPANHRDLVEVTRRANKNIVDFGSLTPAERTASHYAYFYAWMSRATLWSLRALVENPGKAFTLLELGKIGADHALKDFGGPVPQWARDLGVFPVGKTKNGQVKTLNPSSVWTPSSAVSVGEAAVNTAKGFGRAAIGLKQGKVNSTTLAGSLTPGATIFANASGLGSDQGGGGLIGLPQIQALKRGGLDVISPKIADKLGGPSKTYPGRGAGPGFLPLVVGGMYPRATSLDALNKAGRKEHLAGLSPTKKAAFLENESQTKLIANARKVGLLGPNEPIPPELADIFQKRQARAAAYAKADAKTERDKLAVDLGLLVRYGDVAAQSAAQTKREIGKMTDAQVKSLRSRITSQAFGGGTLSGVTKRVNAALNATTAPVGP